MYDIVHIDGGCEVDLSKDLRNGKRQGCKVRRFGKTDVKLILHNDTKCDCDRHGSEYLDDPTSGRCLVNTGPSTL